MKDYILPIILAIIGSGAFSAVVTSFLNRFENRRKRKSSTVLGLMVLLEDRIDYVAGCYIKQGYIRLSDKDRLHRMWNVYHNALGGNGYLDEKMKMVDSLEVRVKE